MIELVQTEKPRAELKPSARKVLKLLLRGSMTAVDFVNAHVLDYRKRVSELNAYYGPGTIISRKVAGHPYYRYEISSDATLCCNCGEQVTPPAILCYPCGEAQDGGREDVEYLAHKEGER